MSGNCDKKFYEEKTENLPNTDHPPSGINSDRGGRKKPAPGQPPPIPGPEEFSPLCSSMGVGSQKTMCSRQLSKMITIPNRNTKGQGNEKEGEGQPVREWWEKGGHPSKG